MENHSLFVQIPIYVYIIVALILMTVTAFKFDKIDNKDKDKDVIFPFTILASILWPIALLMFLLLKIDQNGWDNYNNGEKEQSNDGEDKHE